MHLAEISKRVEKPHTTVRKQLSVFEAMGLISREKKGRQTFYILKQVPLYIDYLTIIEKEILISKCKRELVLNELVNFIHNFNNSSLIFGSAVESFKGVEDVDLLIVGKFKKDALKIEEKKLNLKFHLINVNTIEEVSSSLKNEIIKKHLIIQGSEELIKWMIS